MSDLEERIGSLDATIRDAAQKAFDTHENRATEALPELAKERTKLAEEQSAKADVDFAAMRAEMIAVAQAAGQEAAKATLLSSRSASLAAQVGPGPSLDVLSAPKSLAEAFSGITFATDSYMKASLGAAYVPGDFITALQNLRGNPEEYEQGKAAIAKLAVRYGEAKATLGTSGATGGYVLPNNLVATLVKPNTQVAVYTGANPLVTVIPGVMVRGIDQPYRTGAPAAMTAQDWGATKTNVDEAYGSYTATLGTFAKIYDIGKQYARFSAGAAESDVLDELTKSAALAENKAVIAGPGTGSATPGVNDPTKGLYTSLLGNVFTTAHTASSSTVAGSAAAGLGAAFAALAARSRYPDAAVMDATSYWTLFTQGSDSAGFWMSELLGAGFSIGADNALRWRGVPIYFDANLGTNATTKIAIVGEWKALKFYRGMEFRVDSSDIAGDRWDKNLIGFRGEVEFGVNADTAVAVGAFQYVTGLIP